MSPIIWNGRHIEAVVFDLDGTLIHTTVDFRRMRERLFTELSGRGIPSTWTDPRGTIVSNVERATEYLRSHGRGEEVANLRHAVGQLMDRTEMERVDETTPVKGALECIDSLEANGIRVGILTRGSRAYATAALRYAGLDKRIDKMICRDDHPEEEAKPNGVAMRRMAALLKVEVERCLLVGDHYIDLSCARSASSLFVGVLTGSFKNQDWETHGRPVVVESVADLPALLGIGER